MNTCMCMRSKCAYPEPYGEGLDVKVRIDGYLLLQMPFGGCRPPVRETLLCACEVSIAPQHIRTSQHALGGVEQQIAEQEELKHLITASAHFRERALINIRSAVHAGEPRRDW